MKCRRQYAIMPVGEKDEVLIVARKKPRRSQLRGFSIPFWVGLSQAVVSVQPFADVVADYTCQNREKKYKNSRMRYTPFLYLYGGGSVAHYTTEAEMPQEAISPCLSSKP